MKTINKLFCALFVLTTIVACDLEKITSLQDDLKIYVSPDAVDNKKEITVYDAVTGELVPTPSLSVDGEHAEDVYTSAGDAGLEFDQGEIVIGLKKNVAPTAESPETIYANFSADGYLSKTVEYNFDGTPVESSIVYLIPNGGTDNVKTAASGEKDQSEEISAKTSGTNEFEIKIPANTEFTDKDGNVVTGKINLAIETFDLTIPSGTTSGFNALNEIPKIKFEDGSALRTSTMFKIKPTANGEFVFPSEFSIPVEDGESVYLIAENGTAIEVGQQTAARKTNKSVFLSTMSIFLTQETKNILNNNSLGTIGGLFELNAVTGTPVIIPCNNFINLTNTEGAATSFHITVDDNNTGRTVLDQTAVIYAGNSKNFEFYTGPNSTTTYSVVAHTPNGDVTIVDNESINCGSSITKNVADEAKLPTNTLNINFDVICEKVTIAMDETGVSYRKADSDKYFPYGKMTNGNITGKLPVLEADTEYVFKFNYDGVRTNKDEPIEGSDIVNLLQIYSIDEICEKIEDEL